MFSYYSSRSSHLCSDMGNRILLLLCILLTPKLLFSESAPFIENKGQWEQPFAYYLKLKTAQLYFFTNKLLIDTWHAEDYQKALENAHGRVYHSGRDGLRRHAYEIQFVNTSRNAKLSAETPSTQLYNFYLGNQPEKWKSGLHAYEKIRYENLWDGIDLVYKIVNGRLKYDLFVKPGKDPKQICLKYSGLQKMKLSEGRLILTTSCGEIKELAPIAWQIDSKNTQSVSCRYRIEKNTVLFELGPEYKPELPLTIDPEIIFSTYSGSTGDNWAATATYDDYGNAYMGGINFSPGYPVTTGAYQTNYVGNTDVTITKFNSIGTQAIYSTYLGGNLTEIPHSMIVDSQNNLIVTGSTGSSTFPVTPGAVGPTFMGGTPASFWQTGLTSFLANYSNGADIFVAKFSASGTQLLASSYLGGSSNDGLNLSNLLNHNYGDIFRGEVITDQHDNILIIGTTRSSDLPVKNAWQQTHGGGNQDACYFKLNPQLTQIICCSYFGGSGFDSGYGMALDNNDELYFCGGTNSTDLRGIAALNNQNSGGIEGYIAKVNSNGGSNVTYTYLGSNGYDQCYFVQVDNNGDIVTLGQTDGNYPIQQEGNRALYSIDGGNIFFHKLNSTLTQTRWSTRFGTTGTANHLAPTAFMVDYCNFISFSLWGGEVNAPLYSTTIGLPVTSDAFQPNSTGSDFYLGVLKDNASGLHYGTFFGGVQAREHVDGGTSRFDKKGIIYQSICAGCGPEPDDMPVTPGVWSTTNNSSNCNGAVFKFDLSDYSAIIEELDQEAKCVGKQVMFRSRSTGNPQLRWEFGDGNSSALQHPTHTYRDTGTYQIRLIATAQSSCIQSDTDVVFIKIEDVPVLMTEVTPPLCKGDTTQLQVSGAPKYQWQLTDGIAAEQQQVANPKVAPAQSTRYFVKGESACGTDTASVFVKVLHFDLSLHANKTTICAGDSVHISSSGGTSYTWNPYPQSLNAAGDKALIQLISSGYIYVSALDENGCKDKDSIRIDVLQAPIQPNLRDTAICKGNRLVLAGPNAELDNWYEGANLLAKGVFSVQPDADKVYCLLAENQCGKVNDTIYVKVSFVHAFSGPDTVLCQQESVDVQAGGGTRYAWFPPEDYSEPENALSKLTPKTGTTYYVKVSNDFGCTDTDTLAIHLFEKTQVFAGNDQFIAFGEPVNLSGQAGAGKIKWTGNSLIACDTCHQTSSYTDSTSLFILHYTDLNGCVSTDTLLVQVEGALYLPNAFTPNGDGVNDTFGAIQVDVSTYKLQIFNRWGELLFTSNDPNLGWNGKVKKQTAQDDVYVYKLNYILNSGRKLSKTGTVVLIK